ncbi:MAG: hypothetical protein ACTSQ0_04055 [Candidatus Heimdallarchaeota archaeon]
MVKITVYGAAQEIGRSAILVEDKDTRILLDCGAWSYFIARSF